jgi:hypothetical protein
VLQPPSASVAEASDDSIVDVLKKCEDTLVETLEKVEDAEDVHSQSMVRVACRPRDSPRSLTAVSSPLLPCFVSFPPPPGAVCRRVAAQGTPVVEPVPLSRSIGSAAAAVTAGLSTLDISERDIEATRLYNMRIDLLDDMGGGSVESDEEVRVCLSRRLRGVPV